MNRTILFYVSGHGFGHARRMGLLIDALLRQAPELKICVRTTAPQHVFEAAPSVTFARSSIDAGMAEAGPLTIDVEGTLARLSDLIGRHDEIVAEESAAVTALRPGLIVADIPFLAGHVAASVGVPCVGVSNFTWDWICDPLLERDPRYAPLRAVMRDGYSRMQAVLKLPLGEVSDAFPRRVDVPLIAGRSTIDSSELRHRLQIEPRHDRPIVLVALRGGVPDGALRAAAGANPQDWFLTNRPPAGDLPDNVVDAARAPDLSFSDLVAGSDLVLAKLGYGIVADCMAMQKGLLWPRRTGFREDDIVEIEGPRYLRMREIAHDAFFRGDWGDALAALANQRPPPERMRVDGATVCAREILQRMKL